MHKKVKHTFVFLQYFLQYIYISSNVDFIIYNNLRVVEPLMCIIHIAFDNDWCARLEQFILIFALLSPHIILNAYKSSYYAIRSYGQKGNKIQYL